MKKLLLVALAFFALSCGESNRSDRNEAGADTEQNEEINDGETAQPDTTNTQMQSDTTSYDEDGNR